MMVAAWASCSRLLSQGAEAMLESAETKSEEKTPTETEQIIVTVRARTGEILNAEKVDKNGVRGNLSREQCRGILAFDAASDLESAVFDVLDDGDFLERLALLKLLAR
jgi:hypothetical protein